MSDSVFHQLNTETALAPWHELQRFFAAGQTIYVAEELDLLSVGTVIAEDNATILKVWMDAGQVGAVPDEVALKWFETEADVWTVVVKPWVLVQNQKQPEA